MCNFISNLYLTNDDSILFELLQQQIWYFCLVEWCTATTESTRSFISEKRWFLLQFHCTNTGILDYNFIYYTHYITNQTYVKKKSGPCNIRIALVAISNLLRGSRFIQGCFDWSPTWNCNYMSLVVLPGAERVDVSEWDTPPLFATKILYTSI